MKRYKERKKYKYDYVKTMEEKYPDKLNSSKKKEFYLFILDELNGVRKEMEYKK